MKFKLPSNKKVYKLSSDVTMTVSADNFTRLRLHGLWSRDYKEILYVSMPWNYMSVAAPLPPFIQTAHDAANYQRNLMFFTDDVTKKDLDTLVRKIGNSYSMPDAQVKDLVALVESYASKLELTRKFTIPAGTIFKITKMDYSAMSKSENHIHTRAELPSHEKGLISFPGSVFETMEFEELDAEVAKTVKKKKSNIKI